MKLHAYKGQRSGEESFWLAGQRWQFVTVTNDQGWPDIGVYNFGDDRCYDYLDWRKAYNLN